MTRIPNSVTGMTIVCYDDEDSPEGEVIWDGEAESLGLPHTKTMPRPDPAINKLSPDPDDAEEGRKRKGRTPGRQ